MMEEEYKVNKDMLEALELQVFMNRFEKRKDELLPDAAEKMLSLIEQGYSFNQALLLSAEELVDKIWGDNKDET